VSFFSTFSPFYFFLGTSTHPSFILEYCKQKNCLIESNLHEKLSPLFSQKTRNFFPQKTLRTCRTMQGLGNMCKKTRKQAPDRAQWGYLASHQREVFYEVFSILFPNPASWREKKRPKTN
jgi:hypothetical protein